MNSRQNESHVHFVENEEPEMIIADHVELKGIFRVILYTDIGRTVEIFIFKGEIQFERYLVVNGTFEGTLITNKGNIFVGTINKIS